MRVIDDFLQTVPAQRLFHYTSARGLLGILNEGSIYASSAYHLNDSGEFRYALDLISDQLRARLAFERGPWNSMYGRILDELPSIADNAQVFVASFSEEGDLLSQWLAYSGPLNGFAIGLSPAHFASATAAGFKLVRCVYEREHQQELASAVVDAICQAEGNPHEEAMNKILITAAALKHPGFAREVEWRLIKPITLGSYLKSCIEFREGRLGIVPYIKAPLALEEGEKFIPKAIHIGPNGDSKAVRASVDTLLYSRGLHRLSAGYEGLVEVILSSTPYRP